MGWGLKIGLFFFALIAATFGAWIITIPVLALLFLPPILSRKKNSSGSRSGDEKKGPTKSGGPSVSRVLGVLLLLVSFIAVAVGGVLSPIVLAGLGCLFLFKSRFGSDLSSRVKPVQDSVLLRGSVNPFRWFALAEAKVSTRNPAGALSGVNGSLLLVSAPSPRAFLVFSGTSLTRRRAEESLFLRMQTAARAMRSLGVYLLPLDSEEASTVSGQAAKIEQPEGSLVQSLSSMDLGAVKVVAERGVISAFQFYARDQEKGGSSALESPNGKPPATTFLGEFLQALFQRIGTPQPDRYAAFLSSMGATEGETLGQRITETVQGSDERVVLAASLGSPKVGLSRAQLRAITLIYE